MGSKRVKEDLPWKSGPFFGMETTIDSNHSLKKRKSVCERETSRSCPPKGLEVKQSTITILPHLPFLRFQITFPFRFKLGVEEEERGEVTRK